MAILVGNGSSQSRSTLRIVLEFVQCQPCNNNNTDADVGRQDAPPLDFFAANMQRTWLLQRSPWLGVEKRTGMRFSTLRALRTITDVPNRLGACVCLR